MEKEPLHTKQKRDKPTERQRRERMKYMEKYRQQLLGQLSRTDFDTAFGLLQEAAQRNGGILSGSSPNSLPNYSNRPPIVPEEFRPDPT